MPVGQRRCEWPVNLSSAAVLGCRLEVINVGDSGMDVNVYGERGSYGCQEVRQGSRWKILVSRSCPFPVLLFDYGELEWRWRVLGCDLGVRVRKCGRAPAKVTLGLGRLRLPGRWDATLSLGLSLSGTAKMVPRAASDFASEVAAHWLDWQSWLGFRHDGIGGPSEVIDAGGLVTADGVLLSMLLIGDVGSGRNS